MGRIGAIAIWGTLVLFLAGCSVPGPGDAPARGLTLTLNLSGPRGPENSQGRLLLATTQTVDLEVTTSGKSVIKNTQALGAGKNSVTFSVKLQGQVPYLLKATARDNSGNPVFYGETLFTLGKDTKASLNLLPIRVDAQGKVVAWPTLAAADQPVGSGLGDLGTLATGQSTSFIVDFGTTASAFTLAATDPALTVYAQKLDGTTLDPGTERTVTRKALGTDSQFVLTYYQTGTATLAPLGTFLIPLQSFTLKGPASLAWSKEGDLTVVAVPANATGQAKSDFDWATSDAKLVDVDKSGHLTAGTTNGKATLTATSKGTPTLSATLEVESVKTPVTSVALDQTGPLSLATGTTTVLTATVLPADATDPSIDWTSSDTKLATVDADGTVHALLPGKVTVTATSHSNPDQASTVAVVLTGSHFSLKATDGAGWTDVVGGAQAPAGSFLAAGNAGSVVAYGSSGLSQLKGGLWTKVSQAAPAGITGLALASDGTLAAATGNKILLLQPSSPVWTPVPVAPPAFQGLWFRGASLVVWGTDGLLWTSDGGPWVRSPIPVPTGATNLTFDADGGWAAVGTAVKRWDGNAWTPTSLTVPDQTVAMTTAFGRLTVLVVQ